MLRKPYQILFIIFVVLGLFYPTLFAEFTSIDDVQRGQELLNIGNWSLKSIFFPGATGGLYYRPFVDLSFMLDQVLWFGQEGFMHLENILLHLLNSLLVFAIAGHLVAETDRKSSLIPFITAFAFAIHPLSTESVNWVSGRTDLMACTFILLSALCVFRHRMGRNKLFICLALLSLVMGTMCKEIALAFIPGAFLLLTAKNEDTSFLNSSPRDQLTRILKVSGLFLAVLVAMGLIYYLMRSYAYTTSSGKLGLTVKIIVSDPVHSLFVCLRAFGFYMQKFYFPFPLNFAIVEVDPLYELLALPIVIYCVMLLFKRTLLAALFLSGVFLIMPAFLLAFNQIAWTPYAERYIYAASAFIVLASVPALSKMSALYRARIPVKIAASAILIVYGAMTAQRNIVWMKNLTLFEDTVEKSPNCALARNQYGIALILANNFDKAQQQLNIGRSLNMLNDAMLPESNLAAIAIKQENPDKAVTIYNKMLLDSHGKSERAVKGLIGICENKSLQSKTQSASSINKLIQYYEQLYKLNNDPYYMYRVGHLSYLVGDKKKSLASYKMAFDNFPDGNEYKAFAKKHIVRLEKE